MAPACGESDRDRAQGVRRGRPDPGPEGASPGCVPARRFDGLGGSGYLTRPAHEGPAWRYFRGIAALTSVLTGIGATGVIALPRPAQTAVRP